MRIDWYGKSVKLIGGVVTRPTWGIFYKPRHSMKKGICFSQLASEW